ncbi:hypothetical protein [Streptomyces sp. NPDC003015]
MLLKLTGSSCSGKTTLAYSVGERLGRLAGHDFDEVGVPEGVDRQWRNRMTEVWLRRALEYQARAVNLLLTGQSPLGEVLASPSAPLLDGIAICLIDVSDKARRRRLTKRDADRWDAAAVDAFLGWAAWHRKARSESPIPTRRRHRRQLAPHGLVPLDQLDRRRPAMVHPLARHFGPACRGIRRSG